MVPKGFGWIIYLNPIYYMTEMYRGTMLSGTSPAAPVVIAYVVMCIATFALGARSSNASAASSPTTNSVLLPVSKL